MKLKYILVLALLCLSYQGIIAQSKGIQWQKYPNWNAVLKDAKDGNRPIFVDLYATWCGPCKWMDREVYVNDSVGEFFNREFIRVKVQMDRLLWDDPTIKAWYSSSLELKKNYNVNSFPTLLFLSPSGEIYQKIEGVRDVESLIKEAKEALNPETQFATLIKQYENGNRNPGFVRELVKLCNRFAENVKAREIAQDYINSLTESEMLTIENIWFIYENTKTTRDRGFTFMTKNVSEIEKVEPKMKKIFLDSKVVYILGNQIFWPYSKDNKGKANWKAIYAAAKPFGKDGEMTISWNKPRILFNEVILPFLKSNPDWSNLQKKINDLDIEKRWLMDIYKMVVKYYTYFPYGKEPAPKFKTVVALGNFYFTNLEVDLEGGELANEMAWMGFNNFHKEADLKAALFWSRISVGYDVGGPSPERIDTFANLLYKLGRSELALIHQGLAVQKAPDNKEIVEHLEKMKENIPTWPLF